MIGFPIAEAGHVVNVLAPVSISGGKTGQAFSMKGWDHASIVVSIGVQAAQSTAILVKACTSAAGAGATAIPFYVYKQETAGVGNDVLGSRVAVTSAGFQPSANSGIFYVIEIDSAELQSALGDGSPYIQVSVTDGGNANFWSIVAILSAGRNSFVGSQTATT